MTSDAQDERPAALRLAQTNFKFCDNLTLYGECRYGDNCFFAHSSSEADIFKRWKRAQKVIPMQPRTADLVTCQDNQISKPLCFKHTKNHKFLGSAHLSKYNESQTAPFFVSTLLLLRLILQSHQFFLQANSAALVPRPLGHSFRTRLCHNWLHGTCRFGAACNFAHGEEALRPLSDTGRLTNSSLVSSSPVKPAQLVR